MKGSQLVLGILSSIFVPLTIIVKLVTLLKVVRICLFFERIQPGSLNQVGPKPPVENNFLLDRDSFDCRWLSHSFLKRNAHKCFNTSVFIRITLFSAWPTYGTQNYCGPESGKRAVTIGFEAGYLRGVIGRGMTRAAAANRKSGTRSH